MNCVRALVVTLSLTCLPTLAYSHGGGIDYNGCHTNSKTGEYHCHGGGGETSGGGISYAGKKVYSNYEEVFKSKPKAVKYDSVEDKESIRSAFPKDEVCKVKLKLVLDGDIILVTYKGKDYKIRLYGIDCPEGDQKYGFQASKALFDHLESKEITIEPKDYEDYGLIIGIVYADDMNANERMIKDGLAWQYKSHCNEIFCDEWSAYEEEARESGEGLWKSSEAQAPWEWRKARRTSK